MYHDRYSSQSYKADAKASSREVFVQKGLCDPFLLSLHFLIPYRLQCSGCSLLLFLF